MAIQGKRLYRQALAGGGIAYLTYGWDAGVLGGIMQTKPFLEAMHMPSITTLTMISSVLILGSLVGTLVSATFGMAYGRRTWVQMGNVLEIIGALISATSYSAGQMIAGRVITGIGNGFVISMAPVYIVEMAVQVRDRGRGTFILGAILGLGSAASYWVDFGMIFAKGQVVWRFPVAFQILISLSSMAVLFPLPDTPRWYYAKKRHEDGDDVLRRLCVTTNETESFERTRTAILASLELEKEKAEKLRIKDIFWDTSATQSARRLRIGIILFGITQSQGVSFIFYYATTVFEKYLALPPLTASALSGAMTTCIAITSWITVPFIEKAGRRKWLITGSCLQTVFLAIVTGLSSHPRYEDSVAAAVFMFAFSIVSGSTWGPFPIVYVSELMPLRYRHTGFCLSSSVLALSAWLLVFAAPISYTRGGSHGWTTWIWFLVFNAIAAPYVYLFCPETQGKTLEEIDLIFVSEALQESSAGQKLIESTVMTSDSKDEARFYETVEERS